MQPNPAETASGFRPWVDEGLEVEPVDLLAPSGRPLLARLLPVMGVLGVIAAVLVRRRGGRGRPG